MEVNNRERQCCYRRMRQLADLRGQGQSMFLNLGRIDRGLRIVVGLAIGLAGILISGHPNVGRTLGVLGALVILSGACGS